MIASRLIQTKVTGLGATRSARTGVQSRMFSRQVLRQQIVTLAAEFESEMEEPAADDRPRRGDGRGPRRPKPGPAQTMEVEELDGAVVSITNFGAFINVGCDVDGLLHISQISNEFVKNVADVLEVGQDIRVRVLSVDLEKNKFSLSSKGWQD